MNTITHDNTRTLFWGGPGRPLEVPWVGRSSEICEKTGVYGVGEGRLLNFILFEILELISLSLADILTINAKLCAPLFLVQMKAGHVRTIVPPIEGRDGTMIALD